MQRTVSPQFGPTPDQATTRGVAERIELGTMLQLYTQFDNDSKSQLPSLYNLKPKMGDLNVVLATKVYPLVKFCKGKGKSPSYPSFDKPDLRESSKCPLAFAVMDGMGLWSTCNSLEMRTSWWISIREAVRKGITRNRNSTVEKIKNQMKRCIKAEKAVNGAPASTEPGNFRGFPSLSLYYRNGIQELADMAKSKSLHTLRGAGNSRAFYAFAHYILVETRPAKSWKEVQRTKKLSEFFTVQDEALALVALENGIAHWEKLIQDEENGVEITDGRKRKHCETLYSSSKGKGKGWATAGKARFLEYTNIIEQQRKEVLSKSMEEAIMNNYAEEYNGAGSVGGIAVPIVQARIEDFDEDEMSGLKVAAI